MYYSTNHSNRSSSPALVTSSDEDPDEETKGALKSMIGGNSYLDESITPMMTPMKVEEMQNLTNHQNHTSNNIDNSRILTRHQNKN